MLLLAACETTSTQPETGPEIITGPEVGVPAEGTGSETGTGETGTGETGGTVIDNNPVDNSGPVSGGPISGGQTGTINISTYYNDLTGWHNFDHRAALTALQRSCVSFANKSPEDFLLSTNGYYGQYQDWAAICDQAQATPVHDNFIARDFFENAFLPVNQSSDFTGMVTGYYQPEIQARRVKDAVYSEPILSPPDDEAVLSWPRSKISDSVATPIAYGKPMEVFFMQIQGSGVLNLGSGEKVRAAYAKNNGYAYTSIGRLLVERGEIHKDQSSKQDIENWMDQAGPDKARALMNENKRYIFFSEETLQAGEGPKGAQRVPLTDMASIAVDPSFYPYGLPVWLETQIPSGKGDYKGTAQQLLVIAQDTGKAIRGEHRADLYFGSGDAAGDKAGTMKHPARWTILLPLHLALQLASIS